MRDRPGMRTVGLPCFCAGVTPNLAHRSGSGTVGFPVTLAGHPVTSGDVFVADQDDVLVVPHVRPKEVIGRLPAIREAEGDMDRKVRAGLRWPSFLADG